MAFAASRAMAGLSLQASSASGFLGGNLRLPSTPAQFRPSPSRDVTCMVKKWAKKLTKCKPNSLPEKKKLHVKVGDTVQVIAGKDKGKVTEVTKVDKVKGTVVCRDVNIKFKHKKPSAEGEKSAIITIEVPINSSNVALYSKTEKVRSRVGHKLLEDGLKVRYLIKTGEVIDKPRTKETKNEA